MKIKLPVVWEMCGTIDIEANSIEEALKIFKNTQYNIDLPTDSEYIDDSFQLSTDDAGIIECYN